MKNKYVISVLAVMIADVVLYILGVFDPTDPLSYILYFMVPLIVSVLAYDQSKNHVNRGFFKLLKKVRGDARTF